MTEDLEGIARHAAEIVERRVQQREEHFMKLLTLVVAVGTTVGIILASAAIRWYVSEAVSGSTSAMNQRLNNETSYHRLANLSLSMERRDQFSPNERDAAMELLRVAAQESDISNRADLMVSVEKIIDAFHAAGLGSNLNQINDMFGESLVWHGGISFTMIEHYGQKIVGSGLPLSSMETEQDVLIRYMVGAPTSQTPTLQGQVHFWKMLVEFMRSGKSRATDNLVAGAHSLQGEGQEALGRQVWWCQDAARWQDPTTPEGIEIERLFGEFMSVYPDIVQLEIPS